MFLRQLEEYDLCWLALSYLSTNTVRIKLLHFRELFMEYNTDHKILKSSGFVSNLGFFNISQL